jgi:hypothetical protein
MGSLSMTASGLHTKYHWPPVRSSDLLGDSTLRDRKAADIWKFWTFILRKDDLDRDPGRGNAIKELPCFALVGREGYKECLLLNGLPVCGNDT